MLHIKEIIVRRWPELGKEADFEMGCICDTSSDYEMAFLIIRALISEHLFHDLDFRDQPVFCYPKSEPVKIEVFTIDSHFEVKVVKDS